MVETYGPYLISQLGELMDKTKVCRSLHLCKPPAGHVQLLGGKQCTWGPTYWCQSTQHADACNVNIYIFSWNAGNLLTNHYFVIGPRTLPGQSLDEIGSLN